MVYRGKVLIAAPVHPVLTEGLTAMGYACVHEEKITQELALKIIGDCVGVITSTRLQLDKELIDAAKDLKWIGRMGSGMEVIDVPYATSKGIACYSSPEGNANAVGEHAMGMLLSLTKRITWSHMEVKEGKWVRDANRGIELEGKTIGLIGYGHTGKSFAKKLLAFDMNILAYDIDQSVAVQEGVTLCADLSRIYTEADFVSFHVPLKESTKHYFNADFVEKMHKPFFLINTSRGGVVDTEIVLHGLLEGKVKGACLDVLEGEPMEKMDNKKLQLVKTLVERPDVLITAHIGGYSYEAVYKMSKILLERISHG